jgi:hypothetical protein
VEAPGKRGGVPVSARSTQKEARRQLAEGAAQDSDFAQHCQALEDDYHVLTGKCSGQSGARLAADLWVNGQDVNARRAKVKKYNTDPEYKKKIDEDKRARALAERPPDPIVNAFNIIIPLAPFGIPGMGALCICPICSLSMCQD